MAFNVLYGLAFVQDKLMPISLRITELTTNAPGVIVHRLRRMECIDTEEKREPITSIGEIAWTGLPNRKLAINPIHRKSETFGHNV